MTSTSVAQGISQKFVNELGLVVPGGLDCDADPKAGFPVKCFSSRSELKIVFDRVETGKFDLDDALRVNASTGAWDWSDDGSSIPYDFTLKVEAIWRGTSQSEAAACARGRPYDPVPGLDFQTAECVIAYQRSGAQVGRALTMKVTEIRGSSVSLDKERRFETTVLFLLDHSYLFY